MLGVRRLTACPLSTAVAWGAPRRHLSSPLLTATSLDPEQILETLDRHIIGQLDAKRCVAVAFRNRFRTRSLLSETPRPPSYISPQAAAEDETRAHTTSSTPHLPSAL
jgi:hypothetical protein